MTIEPCGQAAHQTHLTLTARPGGGGAPGGGVSLSCRIQSRSPAAIVGAMLRFVLPPEVIVAASDPAGMILPPLEAGAASTIARDVAIHGATADGTELRFEAALTLPDGRLQRSNIAALCVRNRARLNGPGTFVRVIRTDTPHELVIEAQIVNDGSAPARAVTIDLPPPAGTHPVDPLGPTACTFEQLEPGAARTFAYRVRIAAPTLRSVRATDASLRDGAGNRIGLAASPALSLPAGLTTPELSATRERRRLCVKVRGTNSGPGCARAVEFGLRWPAQFSCSAASLTWNAARVAPFDRYDAFARAQIRDGGVDVAVASIDAGEAYELAFELEATALARAGTLAVDMHAGDFATHTEATLHWSPRTDIRLRIVDAPDEAVDTGTPVRAGVELFNAGDNDSTIAFEVNGAQAQLAIEGALSANGSPFALAAGDRAYVTVAIGVPLELHDGEPLSLTLIARADDEEVARAAFTVRARKRTWIDAHEWLSIDDGADVDCPKAGGAVLGLPAGFDAIVRVPARALTGAAIPVALHIVCAQSTRCLTIRAQSLDAAPAVAGSLTVDDRGAGDPARAPVIYAAGGLVLREIPAGAHIDLRWSVQASASDASGLRIRVDLDADGAAKSAFSQPLQIDRPIDAIALATIPTALLPAAPIDTEPGDTVGASSGAAPLADDRMPAALRGRSYSERGLTLFVALDRARIDACIGLLSANATPGVFSHLCSLRALFPTDVRGGDQAAGGALQAAREAFETVLDRLALKLRMPNFAPTFRDCEDERARRTMRDLLAVCAANTAAGLKVCDDDTASGAPVMEVALDPRWAQQQMTRLANAQPGDPAALGCVIAMVPIASNRSGLHLALERYAGSLRAAFADSSDRLGEAARNTLDAARERLVAALIEVGRELPV